MSIYPAFSPFLYFNCQTLLLVFRLEEIIPESCCEFFWKGCGNGFQVSPQNAERVLKLEKALHASALNRATYCPED